MSGRQRTIRAILSPKLASNFCYSLLLVVRFSHHSAILDALASLTRVELWWDIRQAMGYHGRQCVVILTGIRWSRLKALIRVNITADISATKLGCLGCLHELTCVDSKLQIWLHQGQPLCWKGHDPAVNGVTTRMCTWSGSQALDLPVTHCPSRRQAGDTCNANDAKMPAVRHIRLVIACIMKNNLQNPLQHHSRCFHWVECQSLSAESFVRDSPVLPKVLLTASPCCGILSECRTSR